jgi:hypothetical protein
MKSHLVTLFRLPRNAVTAETSSGHLGRGSGLTVGNALYDKQVRAKGGVCDQIMTLPPRT